MSADCEANYARLSRLLPDVMSSAEARLAGQGVVTGLEAEPIERELLVELSLQEPARFYLAVTEQCRYTTTLELRVELPEPSGGAGGESEKEWGTATGPLSMRVRMYHDVQLAEVIAFSGRRTALASYEYPNEAMFQPDEKAQQNHFLAELLSLSLHKGLALNTKATSLRFDALELAGVAAADLPSQKKQ